MEEVDVVEGWLVSINLTKTEHWVLLHFNWSLLVTGAYKGFSMPNVKYNVEASYSWDVCSTASAEVSAS